MEKDEGEWAKQTDEERGGERRDREKERQIS